MNIQEINNTIIELENGDTTFASCQKLSPVLISLVDMDELLKMIPCKLEKDHKFVIRSKYWYFQKHREELLDESGI